METKPKQKMIITQQNIYKETKVTQRWCKDPVNRSCKRRKTMRKKHSHDTQKLSVMF